MRHLDPPFVIAGLFIAVAAVALCIPTAILTVDDLYGRILVWLVVRREEREVRLWAARQARR